jgi:hypothetical protein
MAEDISALVRRFEPVLIFAEFERFFPSNAKQYIEKCALWYSDLPLDEKESWSGRGNPFPRLPILHQFQIAASNAPGEILSGTTFLGEALAGPNPNHLRFFELGGWLDSSHVTQTSENRRANIETVGSNYNTFLKDSLFWYQAEFFDTTRLQALVSHSDANHVLDLSQVLKQFSALNPALLCYYFFYPCHEESLAVPPSPFPCDKDAPDKDYATYAGEWQCMAILLGREDVNEPYRAQYFGYTGHFDAGEGQAVDATGRIGMSVIPWRLAEEHAELLPRTLDDHPQLWVSRGVHSFYLQPGLKFIAPYLPELAPDHCGYFDSPAALVDYNNSNPLGSGGDESASAAAWAKIIAGGFLAGLGGVIAGAFATALEGLPTGLAMGFDGAATGMPPPPPPEKPFTDVVEDDGQFNGMIVGPEGFDQSFPGAEFTPWAAGQNIQIGTRSYDFLVDRKTQIWWPDDVDESGYRGIWGPLVTNDRYFRRSGMPFPKFWEMFFNALAKSQEPPSDL